MFNYDSVSFRVVETSDIEAIRKLRNDPSTWMNLSDPILITEEAQRQWYLGLGSKSDRKYFAVSDTSYSFIGIIRIDEYDQMNRSVRVGADVVPGLRGRGYGTKIYSGIKKYCFDFLNMHRVWLAVLETNLRAMHLYEKQGFSVEGRYREAIFRNGRYIDYIIMSLLEEEYRNDSPV